MSDNPDTHEPTTALPEVSVPTAEMGPCGLEPGDALAGPDGSAMRVLRVLDSFPHCALYEVAMVEAAPVPPAEPDGTAPADDQEQGPTTPWFPQDLTQARVPPYLHATVTPVPPELPPEPAVAQLALCPPGAAPDKAVLPEAAPPAGPSLPASSHEAPRLPRGPGRAAPTAVLPEEADEAPPGRTLADILAEGHHDLREQLTILARTALAVQRLHDQGWLHLSLRPEAILLVDGPEHVRLLDLSHAVRLGEPAQAPFHVAGYSAPELSRGGPLGRATDVYSLGALLYCIACGAPLPEDGVPAAGGRWPCAIAGVPQLLSASLAPDPERRHQEASFLHRDLLRLLWRMRPTVVHTVEGATTIGLDPERTTNQDSWGHLCGRIQSDRRTSTWSLFCVADGMGGMEAGDVASRTAVSALLGATTSLTERAGCVDAEEQMAMVKRWIATANEQVIEAMAQLGAHGGTTLLCGFVVDHRLVLGHVGDCRAYLFRQGRHELLTRDHSLAMMMVMQGQATCDEIRTNPDRNRVTRSLGDRRPLPEWYVDTLQTLTGSVSMDLQPDDVVMLCSDGIWEPVLEEAMEQIMAEHADDLAGAASALVARALEAGASDNATVVLFRIAPRPPTLAVAPRKDVPACSMPS